MDLFSSAGRYQVLPEEVSLVAGRIIVQRAEGLVTPTLIEGTRLEIECVEISVACTSANRFLLRCSEETATDALASAAVLYPEKIYIQPLPSRLADQAADNLFPHTCRDGQRLESGRFGSLAVEISEAVEDHTADFIMLGRVDRNGQRHV